VIEAGESQGAIVDCFQPVIDEYETGIGKQQSTHRYSAQNQVQAIIHTALPADRRQSVEVMSLICKGCVWKPNPGGLSCPSPSLVAWSGRSPLCALAVTGSGFYV
jgi:hypothetical protein